VLRIDQLYDGNFSGTIDSTDYTNKYWRPMNIYLHGPGAIGQIIKSKWYSYTDDQTATPCTTGEYYYFYDAVGNVVGVWDQRDGAYHSWGMDAFGNPLSGVEFLAMDQPGPKEHLTGKMFDTVTGLYYFHARWLDPEVGRFVSRDKAGSGRRVQKYRFNLNNPIHRVDPDGRDSRTINPNDPGFEFNREFKHMKESCRWDLTGYVFRLGKEDADQSACCTAIRNLWVKVWPGGSWDWLFGGPKGAAWECCSVCGCAGNKDNLYDFRNKNGQQLFGEFNKCMANWQIQILPVAPPPHLPMPGFGDDESGDDIGGDDPDEEESGDE